MRSSPTETDVKIAEARRILRPSPVQLRKIPAWFKRAIRPLFGSAEERELLRIPRGFPVRLDHWGATTWNGRPAFVTEVYDLNAEDLLNAQTFAERIGCCWRVSANSWHYPGQTIRLLFFQQEPDVAFPGTRRELNGNSGTRSADPMTSHRSPTSRTPDADQVEGATP